MIKLNETSISKVALTCIILSTLILVTSGFCYISNHPIVATKLALLGLWCLLLSQLLRVLLTSIMFYINHEKILAYAALVIFLVLGTTILVNIA